MKSEFCIRLTAALGVFSLAIRLIVSVWRHFSCCATMRSISLISTGIASLLRVCLICCPIAGSHLRRSPDLQDSVSLGHSLNIFARSSKNTLSSIAEYRQFVQGNPACHSHSTPGAFRQMFVSHRCWSPVFTTFATLWLSRHQEASSRFYRFIIG